MSLDDEITWWTNAAFKSKTDAGLIAFGVATGLKMAKADYGAKDDNLHLERSVTCKCGWSGRSGELIAKHTLVCPKCGDDEIKYVIAPTTGQRQ